MEGEFRNQGPQGGQARLPMRALGHGPQVTMEPKHGLRSAFFGMPSVSMGYDSC